MEWSDLGIVLNAKPHGETHSVVEVFTREQGRWAALVYGGQGRRMQPVLQAGNSVSVDWKGRLSESLGHFSLEMSHPRAAEVMHDRLALAGLSSTCAIASACLPEREAHARAFHAMAVVFDNFDAVEIWPALMARWELGLLAEVGFGLTLDRCAATGGCENLIYVSPRSACAVSAQAGEPYKDKLLPLPAFLCDGTASASAADVLDALTLTGYFIETRILHLANRPLPEARLRLMALLQARASKAAEDEEDDNPA